MKHRESFLLALAVLSSSAASAQILARAPIPSAPRAGLAAAAPIPALPEPFRSSVQAAMATPVLAASAGTASAVGGAAQAVPQAVASARAIAASVLGPDAAPALSAAFDGLRPAASVPVDAAAEDLRTPEDFARKAERLFTAGRLPAGMRAAVAWHDAVRPLGVLPTDEEMRARMARSPLSNAEREQVTIELFKLGGAKPEEIVVQDIGRGQNNIMVVKKGRSDRVIVLGGHHDKVDEGSGTGTIDNWTGATLVTNLYQALHGEDTDATIVFISFGREEDGLIGSERYLKSLSKGQRAKIDAMVNLDTLAVDGTFSWKNNSTRALLDRIQTVATATKYDLQEAYLNGGDADSSTFRQAGIPAMTVFGASQEVIFDIIHSENDTMAAFNLGHYTNAFHLTLELLKSLDREKLGPVGRAEV